MAETVQGHPKGLFGTLRRDRWWIGPVLTVLVLGAFGVYSLFVAVLGAGGPATFIYTEGGREYMSPFFSPCINHATCGEGTGALIPIFSIAAVSPAWFVMWAPLGLRATCYYYRKAYYRAFFWDPPGCSIGEARHKYHGERTFPFVLQNLHRYFLYVALLFPIFLFWDAIAAFIHHGADGTRSLAIGLGSIILFTNAALLTGFTLGCHALRHWVGGNLNCYSCSGIARTRHRMWKVATWFNIHHARWAWVSLVVVGLTDVYIRGLINGWWSDPYFITGVHF